MRWLALLALLLVPLAQAGSAEDPEITDPDDDGHPMEAKDLVKAWIEPAVFEDAAPALWFRIETAGDFEHVPALFALHERYRVAFKVDGEGADEWYLAISPSRGSTSAVVTTVPNGPESVSCKMASSPAGGSAPLAEEVMIESTFDAGNQFGCIVSYAALGMQPGQAITDLYVEHVLVARGPLSGNPPTGGDNIPYTVIETFDRAPDTGFGRVYQTASAASAVTYLDAAFPVDLQQAFVDPTSGTYHINWTSPGGNLSLVLGVAGNGSVAMQILVGNESVYMANATASGNHTLAGVPAGNGTVLLSYQDFQGDVTLAIATAQDAVGGNATVEPTGQADAHGDDDTTDDGHSGTADVMDGDDKDAPVPLLVAVASLGLAAALRRRR